MGVKDNLSKILSSISGKLDKVIEELNTPEDEVTIKRSKDGSFIYIKGKEKGTQSFSESLHRPANIELTLRQSYSTKDNKFAYSSIEEAEFITGIIAIEQEFLKGLGKTAFSDLTEPEERKELIEKVVDYISKSKYSDKETSLTNADTYASKLNPSDPNKPENNYHCYRMAYKKALEKQDAIARVVEIAEKLSPNTPNDKVNDDLNKILQSANIQLPKDFENDPRIQDINGVKFLEEVLQKAVKAIEIKYKQIHVLVGDAHKDSVIERLNSDRKSFEDKFNSVTKNLLIQKITDLMKTKIKTDLKIEDNKIDEYLNNLKDISIDDPYDDKAVNEAFKKLKEHIKTHKENSSEREH